MPRLPLSLFEREKIGVALIEDRSVSWAETGRTTGGYATTISREVTEKGGRDRYRPAVADGRAANALCRSRPRRLAVLGSLSGRAPGVTAEFRWCSSPVAIWADRGPVGSGILAPDPTTANLPTGLPQLVGKSMPLRVPDKGRCSPKRRRA
jgi:hypothetical protein